MYTKKECKLISQLNICQYNQCTFSHEKYSCTGSFPLEKKVVLGSWERGKRYILSITQVKC